MANQIRKEGKMANVVWQAKVSDEDWGMLKDQDLDELCEKLSDFWDKILEAKIRMRIIDKAIAETPA